jgi:hypothetical protein
LNELFAATFAGSLLAFGAFAAGLAFAIVFLLTSSSVFRRAATGLISHHIGNAPSY